GQGAIGRVAVEKLRVVGEEEAYCQPCYSPVWDTGLTCHALLEVGGERALAQVNKGLEWLKGKQILDLKGDWAEQRPDLRPGGWAFQYNNAHYPDVDDTAVGAPALDPGPNIPGRTAHSQPIARPRGGSLRLRSESG